MQTALDQAEGGCLCKALRYRVIGVPLSSIVCHCISCRKASAAPSVAWLTFDRVNFKLLSGTLRGFESSPGVMRKFCSVCGSSITYESVRNPGTIDVTTASLDQADRFPPTREVWLEHKVGWEVTNQSVDQFPRGSGEGPPIAG